jgi:pyruvyl transferase EpsO
MNFSMKVNLLKQEIEKKLMPLMNNDCCFLGLPYYTNIGDILIWQGTEYFIKELGIHCRYRASIDTFKYKQLDSKSTILLQGGGNFGDLWNGQHDFRRKIITIYPNNQIIILPQTIFYLDKDKLFSDVELFRRHKYLTICARDKESYNLLKQYFSVNNILLVPDMAFCIPSTRIKNNQAKQINKDLFLRRTDRELNTTIDYYKYIHDETIDIFDWPTIEKKYIRSLFLRCLLIMNNKINYFPSKLIDVYASCCFKKNMIDTGIKFIGQYNKIYTTRLHAAILCCLLEKPFVFFNNSYGKNRSVYETWLSDLDYVKFY